MSQINSWYTNAHTYTYSTVTTLKHIQSWTHIYSTWTNVDQGKHMRLNTCGERTLSTCNKTTWCDFCWQHLTWSLSLKWTRGRVEILGKQEVIVHLHAQDNLEMVVLWPTSVLFWSRISTKLKWALTCPSLAISLFLCLGIFWEHSSLTQFFFWIYVPTQLKHVQEDTLHHSLQWLTSSCGKCSSKHAFDN